MKLSGLIYYLQEIQQEHGDLTTIIQNKDEPMFLQKSMLNVGEAIGEVGTLGIYSLQVVSPSENILLIK
tara:strand:+ start:39 stop:245 length:207 start_codon:yes stop_codon:yes gene_type:complete